MPKEGLVFPSMVSMSALIKIRVELSLGNLGSKIFLAYFHLSTLHSIMHNNKTVTSGVTGPVILFTGAIINSRVSASKRRGSVVWRRSGAIQTARYESS